LVTAKHLINPSSNPPTTVPSSAIVTHAPLALIAVPEEHLVMSPNSLLSQTYIYPHSSIVANISLLFF